MHFILSNKVDKVFKQVCKKHKSKESKWDGWEAVYNNFGTDHYIFVDDKHLTHNTIAHEIFHASSRICENRAINDEEAKCWVCGYITQEIYKALDKKKIAIRHG